MAGGGVYSVIACLQPNTTIQTYGCDTLAR